MTYLREVRARPDTWLTVGVLLLGALLSWPPHNHWTATATSALVLGLAAWAPLPVRARYPRAVTVLVVAIDTAHIGLVAHSHLVGGVVPLASMLALYSLAATRSARTVWAVAAVTAAAQVLTATLATPNPRSSVLLYLNWPLVAAALGRLLRERRDHVDAAEARAEAAEASKHSEAQRQVTAERLRIARDLHDVLAHHVAVVNAQAGVAQYLLKTDPDAAERALSGIAANTRAALDELRVTLGVLRADGEDGADTQAPTPGVRDIAALITESTALGLTVERVETGTPRPLPGPADVGLHRITQEALTNAGKHAPGSRVTVRVDWCPASVVLTVANTVANTAADATAAPVADLGTGHGLVGMRERAVSAGGTLEAAPTADGGFRVRVELPA